MPVGDGRRRVPRLGAEREARRRSTGGDARARGRRRLRGAARRRAPGDDYRLLARRRQPLADPCSRWQPEGLRGPSRVLDTAAFAWTRRAGRGAARRARDLRAARRHVHAGGHLRRGGRAPARAGRARRDRDRADAGRDVPRASAAGATTACSRSRRTAPTAARRGSRASSTRRTRAGLAVILDVVYNHVGPGSELLARVRPVLHRPPRHLLGRRDRLLRGRPCASGRSRTPSTGCATTASTACGSTRRTRSSTTSRAARPGASSPTACARSAPGALVISEMEIGDRAADRGVGPRRAVGRRAPPRAARPADRRAGRLLRALRHGRRPCARRSRTTPAERLVICAQNHDQVGNRAFGDRLPPAVRRLAAAVRALRAADAAALHGRGVRRGTRRSSSSPTTTTRAIADATREGRRREFARFAAFAREDVPDPQARATFERSKLHPESGDAELRAFYRALLALRAHRCRREVETEVDEAAPRAAGAPRRRRARRRLSTRR